MTRPRRNATLGKGRKRVVLEMGQGHVWETDSDGTLGWPLYDAAAESRMFATLLRRWRRRGFAVLTDTGPPPSKVTKKAKKPSRMR